jgi:hypothetical protein
MLSHSGMVALAPDPEPRHSGFDAAHRPGVTDNFKQRHAELSNPSLRAQAKQSIGQRAWKRGLLRFARNDGAKPDTPPPSRGAFRPGCARKTSAQTRAWGMPGAQRTRSLAWKNKNHTSVVTTSPPGQPGIPARNGSNGFFRALPGDRAFLPPSPKRINDNVRARSGRHRLRQDLTPASRRQDHTTSPSATASLVVRASRSLTGKPALQSSAAKRRRVHRILFQRP